MDLIKRGVGTFSILGAITFEGRMISEGGRIWITESGGNALNVSRYIARNNGLIEVGSGRPVNLQRLNTNAVMELHQGRFQSSGDFQNTDAVNTTQQTGNILLSGGLNAISINYANNNGTALTTNSVFAPTLTRDNNATLLVRGRNLGIPATGTAGASAFYFTDSTFNTTLTNQLVGGGGAAGTTTISILPYAIGGTTMTVANTFVTYDSTVVGSHRVGFRPLNTSTEFATDLSSSTLNTNVRRNSGQTLASAAVANALILVGNNTITANGGLTLQSGALLYNGSFNQTGTISGTTLNTGGRELVISNVLTSTSGTQDNFTNVVINAVIDDVNGLTYGAISMGAVNNGQHLILNAQNTYTGTTTTHGVLEVSSTGSLGSGNVMITSYGRLIARNDSAVAETAIVSVLEGGLITLDFIGDNLIGAMNIAGVLYNQAGTYGHSSANPDFAFDTVFTADSTGVFSVIPEPQTYALFLGALSMAMVVILRRRSSRIAS